MALSEAGGPQVGAVSYGSKSSRKKVKPVKATKGLKIKANKSLMVKPRGRR